MPSFPAQEASYGTLQNPLPANLQESLPDSAYRLYSISHGPLNAFAPEATGRRFAYRKREVADLQFGCH